MKQIENIEESFFSPILFHFNSEEEETLNNINYSDNSFFLDSNLYSQLYTLHSNPVEYAQEIQNENIDKEVSEFNQEMANEGELNFSNRNPFSILNIPSLPIIDEKERIEREMEKEKQNNLSENNPLFMLRGKERP